MVEKNQRKSTKQPNVKTGDDFLSEIFREQNPRSKPYSCKMCKASFRILLKFQEHATKHMLKGLGASSFPCELCNESFESYCYLEAHMKSHTGEKPHKCSLCPKRFVQKQHMKRHLQAEHTLEKPFKCHHCTKTFSRNDFLIRHTWLHTKENHFNCDQCSETFKTPYAVGRHVKKCHQK